MNFKEDLEKNGISLSDEQLNLYNEFYNLLIEENKITNLTRIINEEDVYYLHFYDSLIASLPIDKSKDFKLCDIGAGPGFPSIPLKIYMPNMDLTIVEATNKKVEFIKNVCNKLNLNNVHVNHLRAEDFTLKDTFDYVTTRAVSKIVEQLPYTIPFLKIGGKLISMKGQAKAQEEIMEATSLLKRIGAKVIKTIDYDVMDRKYTLVVIEKIKETPKEYPKPISRRS